MKTLFFTGHRPSGLPGGWEKWPEYEIILTHFLRGIVSRAYKKGFRNFICGGALGTDQAASMAVFASKHEYKDIVLSHYLPFKGFDSKWSEAARTRFAALNNRANLSTYICEPPYAAWKLNRRNEAMVDNATCGIAVWSGSIGGTSRCVEYAAKQHVPMLIVDPESFETRWMLNKEVMCEEK